MPLDPTLLMRLTRYPATEPYWGKSQSSRFDDPDQVYGATYTARSLTVAFAETILHQKGHFVDGRWIISQADIALSLSATETGETVEAISK